MEKKRNVLIVDDKFDNLIAGMVAVRELELEPLGASSAEEALKAINNEEGLLAVLTDMDMHEDSEAGIEIVKECCRKAIPVGVVAMADKVHHGHHSSTIVRMLVPVDFEGKDI